MLKFFRNKHSRLRFIARLRLKLKMMLSLDVSPKVLAKASAWGALIGISPYVHRLILHYLYQAILIYQYIH